MVADIEGFLYPSIDKSKCIQCGLCKEVCPSLNRDAPRMPIAVYAARSTDEELRMKSSSGGLFTLLARQILANGGIVYGAGFDHVDWHVMHKSAETEEELEDLRGSKYAQSDVRGIFTAVWLNLKWGRRVLFSGTPCQIAGLRRYLDSRKTNTTNLTLVDVVCHAVPSPLAWRKYLDERLAKTGPGAIIRRISSRHKNCGWRRYSLSLRFANDKEYLRDLHEDPYLRGFLKELYNRPSCHNCQCRELRSGSDLTIADYWNVQEKFPDMDDDRGTSLVLVNTEAGAALLARVAPLIEVVKSDFYDAVRVNSAIVQSTVSHRNRSAFFRRVAHCSFDDLVDRLLKRPAWRRALSFVRRGMRRL